MLNLGGNYASLGGFLTQCYHNMHHPAYCEEITCGYMQNINRGHFLSPSFSVIFISVAARTVLHPPALHFAQGPETTESSDQ